MAITKIKQGDTLGALAIQHNTTVADLQKINPNITNPNVIQAGADLNIPDAPVIPVKDVSKISIDDIPKATFTTEETPQFDFTGTLKELTDKTAVTDEQKATDIAATPEVQAQQTQLNELNQQIRLHQVKALENQELARVSGYTSAFGAGEAQRVARNDTFEAMRLAAISDTVQGNLALAENRSERALDIKYKAQTDNIAAARRMLIANYDNLTSAQQKQVDQRLLELNDKDSFVVTQKAEQKAVFDVVKDTITAARGQGQTIPNSVITNALKAKTADEALSMLAGYGVKAGGITTGGLSSNAQAVIENPNLLNSYTNTVKGQVIAELQQAGYDTSNLGVKPLSDTAIKEINQTDTALASLQSLRDVINKNLTYVGPISGLQKYNPYSKARQVQAEVDRVRQMVGKALEGGVLRKEDEEKYKKILATITDTPETALYKIDALISTIKNDTENYKNLQLEAGRTLDIKRGLEKKGTEIKIEDLRTKYNY